jgi:hypothetical protein
MNFPKTVELHSTKKMSVNAYTVIYEIWDSHGHEAMT